LISFGPDVCRDFDRAVSKEWLETDGLGGYACSTIIGANTRRYHGLLIAALRPPTERTLLLSKLEETLAVGDLEYDLSCNQYPGAIHPQGHLHLRTFRLDPFPTFVYEVGSGVRLEKTVAMCHGRGLTIVRYRLVAGGGTVGLIVRPLVNCRNHHHLTRENPHFSTAAQVSGAKDVVTLQPYPHAPALHLYVSGSYFEPWGHWYHNFEYREEAARGLDYREDQYSPGFFTVELEEGDACYVLASTEPPRGADPEALLAGERRRRAALAPAWAEEGLRTLARSADAFLVGAPEAGAGQPHGVIAGYPWFEVWGRDTMISLPGLTLVTGRPQAAASVLRAFARQASQGMIPNRIPDRGEQPDYNTVDATLWMFWAAHKHLDYTGDRELVEGELLPLLLDIIEWHMRGTRYGIGVAEDGLLRAGGRGTQLTWMDAKVGDWVVTPRHGKPVEVNALWHHALRFVEGLGARHAGPPAEEVRRRFEERFWNEEVGHLNDVVDGDAPADASLRPNQIIAVSLPYPALEGERARQVVDLVRRHLLTPYGLRTLSPHDPRYCGRYEGDVRQRDGAYHQGTVWAWLLGPFLTAYVRTAPNPAAARREARRWLAPLWDHLQEAGLGHVSEIFDGDPPHRPRGCIAQAWSTAEVLRAAIEDLGLGAPAQPSCLPRDPTMSGEQHGDDPDQHTISGRGG